MSQTTYPYVGTVMLHTKGSVTAVVASLSLVQQCLGRVGIATTLVETTVMVQRYWV